jgi:hypothetical protein
MSRPPQQTHPFGPVLLALLAVVVLAALYGLFGVGRGALAFAGAALLFYTIPVAVIFGITGIVMGVRRLTKKRPAAPSMHDRVDELPRKPPQLS